MLAERVAAQLAPAPVAPAEPAPAPAPPPAPARRSRRAAPAAPGAGPAGGCGSGDVPRRRLPDARRARCAARPARLGADRRPGARPRSRDRAPAARASSARSRPACSGSTSQRRRWPRRCRCSRRRTAGRSPTRSSTSPTTRSGDGCAGRSSRGQFRQPLSTEEKRWLLERPATVEAFEEYLRRSFLGQKQFSIEGLDVMVPMLDESIELAARQGAHGIVMGMAHRGRLSVLAHTLGQPYEAILREFEGERVPDAVVGSPEGGTGDVKYHLGAVGARETEAGTITITLVSNPSHLEAVDPVVEGWTRADQTDRSAATGRHSPSVTLPILIHGDASFAGQGVVAETFNLEGLPGYSTGGTLHLIANNQVGFTTDPNEGRSTRYSSDLAKGFDAPIIHVNADDPEAAISAVRLALAFRERFGHDVVVDLVGYRRFGHNEQDEPAYTQPLMAQAIAEHPTVRAQLAERLVAEERRDGRGRRAHGGRDARGDEGAPTTGCDRRSPSRTRRSRARRRQARRRSSQPSPPTGCASLDRELVAVPDRFTDPSEARAPARAAPRGAGAGRHRLGSRGGAGARLTARRGHSRPADRSGHRAGNVLAPSPRPPRRSDRRALCADPAPDGRRGLDRAAQLAALRVRARSASTTATRWRRRRRSCSGRRSSATS